MRVRWGDFIFHFMALMSIPLGLIALSTIPLVNQIQEIEPCVCETVEIDCSLESDN